MRTPYLIDSHPRIRHKSSIFVCSIPYTHENPTLIHPLPAPAGLPLPGSRRPGPQPHPLQGIRLYRRMGYAPPRPAVAPHHQGRQDRLRVHPADPRRVEPRARVRRRAHPARRQHPLCRHVPARPAQPQGRAPVEIRLPARHRIPLLPAAGSGPGLFRPQRHTGQDHDLEHPAGQAGQGDHRPHGQYRHPRTVPPRAPHPGR